MQAGNGCAVGCFFEVLLLAAGNLFEIDPEVDSVDLNSGQGVSYWIFLSLDMHYGAVEFCDSGEVTLLTGGPSVGFFGESMNQGPMVCLDREGVALEEVTEMTDCKIDGEELTKLS